VRRRWLIALGLMTLLVAASVSYTGCYTLETVDTNGHGVTAYAIYNHQGEWLNPAHPVSYNATRRTVVRSDDAGRLRVPSGVHVHLPFPLQTHPKLWIEMVYVPRLHNAEGRISPGYAASTAGVWEMDAAARRAVVFDLSDRPERWQGTLSNLSFFIRPLVSGALSDMERSAAVPLAELIGHFRAEYDAFLARYGDVHRPPPPMPVLFSDEEKRRWAEMVEADLAREPTWGMQIRRLYEREISSLSEIEASLRRITSEASPR
jgi:hypothetical protein